MVRVSPPPRSLGLKSRSGSAMAVASHEHRIDQECDQLLTDIRRIEPEGEPHVLFGKLFDDDQAQQYYEALVGTLKCAKKRGQITFKGQMLLKGMHDNVKISIVDNGGSSGEGKPVVLSSSTPKASTPPKPRPKPMKMPSLAEIAAKAAASKEATAQNGTKKGTGQNGAKESSTEKVAKIKKQTEVEATTSAERPPKPSRITTEFSFSPTSSRKQLRRKGALTQEDRVCSSDSEAVLSQDEYGVGGASDSECLVGLRSPRRLVLPKIFMAEDSRPPAGWRRRDNGRRATISSTREVLKSKENSQIAPTEEKKPTTVATAPAKKATPPEVRKPGLSTSKPAYSPQRKALTPPPSRTTTARPLPKPLTPPKPTPSRFAPPRKSASMPVGRRSGAHEASALVDDEVVRLLVDIRRVGTNPGEPTVTFGELFDDEKVQNTYEALVGTLRSAKRRGLISFKGQMLLKGMHDAVVISLVDTGAAASN